MANKYLTLEEAANASGLSVDEVKRLREKGDLRGFADRGTWKFREKDVEELRRSLQDDSSPEAPIFDSDSEEDSSVLIDDGAESAEDRILAEIDKPTEIQGDSSDEDVELSLDDSESDVQLILGDSMKAAESEGDSDSDVRLVGNADESGETGSDSDVKLVESDSDSGVRLAPDLAGEDDSDSDVKLITEGSDSDVKLLAGDDDRSDSDVAVVAAKKSGLPVDFADTDEDLPLLSEENSQDDSEALSADLSADSGVSLENANDSGIPLHADDSGITLENLADSGVSLSDDLSAADESGISLELDDDEGQTTVPMLEIPDFDEDLDETQLEIPALGSDDESAFDLVMEEENGNSDADVIFFEEDETGDASESMLDLDDNFDDEMGTDVSAEDDLDVFDAVDEDFEDSFESNFESGESHPGFDAPAVRGRGIATVETDWGVPTFVGLIFSTALLSLCCMVMFDLVRSIWVTQDPKLSSWLLTMIGGMFS
jgi:hypothetical protein